MNFQQDHVNCYIRKISIPKVSKASRTSADLHDINDIRYSPVLNCRRPMLPHNLPPIGRATSKLCDAYFIRSLPRWGRWLKILRRLLHPLPAKMWSMLKNSATLIQFTPAEVWSMLIYNDANFENVKILLLASASTNTTTNLRRFCSYKEAE